MNHSQAQVYALQAGNEFALSHFMDAYTEQLRFYAYKLVKDKSLAEEITADAFIKLWHNRLNFSDSEKIKSFLYVVTRNACLDQLKSPRHNTLHEESLLAELASPDPDVLSQMIYIEMLAQVALEMSNLPKQQAAVFQLAYFEGKDTSEISAELETSVSNVYFARSKALSAIKNAFKKKNISSYPFLFFFYFLLK